RGGTGARSLEAAHAAERLAQRVTDAGAPPLRLQVVRRQIEERALQEPADVSPVVLWAREEPLAVVVRGLRPRDDKAGVERGLDSGDLDLDHRRAELPELVDRRPHQALDLGVDHVEVVVRRHADADALEVGPERPLETREADAD